MITFSTSRRPQINPRRPQALPRPEEGREHARSSFSDPGLSPYPLQWKCGVLTTGQPETQRKTPPTGRRPRLRSRSAHRTSTFSAPGKPHMPAAKMSSKRAKAKTTKKWPQRATSNVFVMFDQSQIQEFKEAFNMIDQNRDGFIDKEDLHDTLASMGKNPTDEYLEGMMSEAPGPINFTMFLTMFGEKLNGTDSEDVIRNAFACFDEEASGFIHEDHLRELLTTMGDRFTDEEVDEMYREAPIDKKGNFNYVEFTRILKHGAKDNDN
ncbi:myosin regulatory light chain 2, smooth muscle major isoform-like isoform X1 [Cervus elaphus]|uniref:myosin regulatory light chain 2, smooth muscle major isoform-like isoform X1 n=1 Tax=Cervus elaphus TaxID=9860 RepID=UPI001CC27265|nr:myosin regulatory light chain 2, smooth muscle major isoform-like isoform X1 [Cervus elaphus]